MRPERAPWNHNIHYHPVILDAVPDGCQRALDVGCGEGMLARDLRDVVPEVVAIDSDGPVIERARRLHLGGAGLHALLRLPPGQREEDLVARAARHGLAVEGLGEYAMGSHHAGPALVVGYATPPPHAYTTAIARLCAVLAARD